MAITDESVAKITKVRDFIAQTPGVTHYTSLEEGRITIDVALTADDVHFLSDLQRLFAPA